MLQSLILVFVIALSAPGLGAQQAPEPAAQFNRAVALQQQGKLEEAAAEYRALLKLKPDYAEAHANLGVVLARLNHYDGAAASYETALRLNPKLTPILLNLGILYHRADQFEKAVANLEKFLAENPNHQQARQLLGIALVELGRDKEAIAQLDPIYTAGTEDSAALYSLGLAYVRLDKARQQDVIDRLASLPSGAAAARLLQGQAWLKRLEFEKAVAELLKAQKLNPELPRVNYSLGLAYVRMGRNKDAIAAFENELRRNPRDFATLYYLASMQEAEGDLTAARKNLEAAIKLAPQSTEANALLSKILSKQGKGADALGALEKAVAADPADPVKRYQLARLYRQLGRKADADREFAEVQRLKDEQLKKDRARTPKP